MPFLKTVSGIDVEVDKEDYHRLFYNRYHVVSSSNIVQRAIYSTRLKKTTGRIGIAQDILRVSSDKVVMFIDGNTFNCKKSNLKIIPAGKKNIRAKLSKRNTTGYRGVSYNEKTKKYIAYIRYNYKKIYLGSFKNIIEAATTYDKKAIELFGPECKQNIPVKK